MQINLRALSVVLIMSGIISAPTLAAVSQDNSTEVLLRGAKKWEAKNRSDLAKNMLYKLILIDPTSPEALLMLGNLELKDGRTEEALRYLQMLEKAAPKSKQTENLRNAYRAVAKTSAPATAKRVDPTATEAPTKTPTRLLATEESSPTNDSSSAKKSSKKDHPKIAVNPDKVKQVIPSVEATPPAPNPDVIARTDALDALADGNIEVAEASLLDILQRRPEDPEVLGGLGQIKQKQGKFDEAEKWFTQALEAATKAKVETERWVTLIRIAQFSQHLSKAKKFLEEDNLAQAEMEANQANTLMPQDPTTMAVMGNIKIANSEFVAAENLYREALKIEAENIFATQGLAILLVRTNRSSEAIDLIETTLRTNPSTWKKNPASHASLLRQLSVLYTEDNRTDHAMSALEQAIQLDPKNVWVRFSLAKLYISLNLRSLARPVMDEGVALMPDNPEMHHVRALVLLSIDEYAAALSSFAKIPEESLTPSMREMRNQALVKYNFQQAELKLAQGNRKEAIRIMSIVETQVRDNYAATEQVAESWFKLGLEKQGLSAMRKLPEPLPLATQVRYASLLNRAKQDQELADYLPTLKIPAGEDEINTKHRKTILDIELAMAGRQFDKLWKANKKEEAQSLAEMVLGANQLSNAEYFRFHRSYFSKAELQGDAIAQLNDEKEQFPEELGVRLDLADAYNQDKQKNNARRELDEVIKLTKNDDIPTWLRIAQLQQSIGDSSGARKTMYDLTTRYPNNADILLQAGNIARADGDYNEAMDYFSKTKTATPSVTPSKQLPQMVAENDQSDILLKLLPAQQGATDRAKTRVMPAIPPLASNQESDKIYRAALASDTQTKGKPTTRVSSSYVNQAMDSIEALRAPKIESGVEMLTKSGVGGMSTYNVTEIPTLVRFPIGYEAHGSVQIDKVNIDAGTLALADRTIFGKGWVFAQPVPQQASGTSFGLGYEQGSVKADLGVAGQGFAVSNVVGGLRKSGQFGRLSYTLKLDRRPYTGSLLAYAGAKDPVTGVTWGGVTSTGPTLYMSTTLSSSSLGETHLQGMGSYSQLRGQNVLNNSRLLLSARIDKDIYATDDTVLNLGLKVSHTSFANNQSFYTFGHGGYYSPKSRQDYVLMLEAYGREDALSYQVIASAMYAKSSNEAALYFPTDSALQIGNGGTVYAANSAGSFAYGLLAAAEYRASPNLALGGRLNIDRSTYYSPNSVLFYLRYMFNPETGPIKMRPEPIVPYAKY